MITGLIYRAYDSTGKSYIGQTTKKLEQRIKKHYRTINNGIKFHNALLINDLDFTWEILEDNIPEEQLLEREQYWCKVYDSCKNGYNGKCISCFPRNIEITEETRNKISEANKGVNNGFYGKTHSEETKILISKTLKGRNAWNKGQRGVYHHSEETKQKMRENRKYKHWKLVNGKRVYYE